MTLYTKRKKWPSTLVWKTQDALTQYSCYIVICEYLYRVPMYRSWDLSSPTHRAMSDTNPLTSVMNFSLNNYDRGATSSRQLQIGADKRKKQNFTREHKRKKKPQLLLQTKSENECLQFTAAIYIQAPQKESLRRTRLAPLMKKEFTE